MTCDSQTHIQSALGDVGSSSRQNEHLPVVSAVDVATTNRSACPRHWMYTYTGTRRHDKFIGGKFIGGTVRPIFGWLLTNHVVPGRSGILKKCVRIHQTVLFPDKKTELLWRGVRPHFGLDFASKISEVSLGWHLGALWWPAWWGDRNQSIAPMMWPSETKTWKTLGPSVFHKLTYIHMCLSDGLESDHVLYQEHNTCREDYQNCSVVQVCTVICTVSPTWMHRINVVE